MHRKVAAALVAALAFGAASCGGAASLSRAELVSKMESVCRQATKQAQSQSRPTGRASQADAGLRFLTNVLRAQRTIEARIEDLHAPDELKTQFETFKATMKERTALYTRVAAAGAGGLQAAMTAANAEATAVNRRLQQAADQLGVRGCV